MTKDQKQSTFSKLITNPVKAFINDSRSVGILLIICTIISLVLSNSAIGSSYFSFWHWEYSTPGSGLLNLPHSVELFINDALMAIFFLLVGMEIKAEIVHGQMSSLKKSVTPIFAALGGMLIPALFYILWNSGTAHAHGWGIAMATDIAFSLGILSLLGKRVPISLKILLTALAIIDDLGAILVIAIFYPTGEGLDFMNLAIAGGIFGLLLIFNRLKIKQLWLYLSLGVVLWYFMFNSGVHATVAGVLVAFALPMSLITKVEHAIANPVNFIILPLFALANTAILLPADSLSAFADTITYGITMGLVLGKPIGITLFVFLAVKLGLGQMPEGLKWKHVFGMGLIAGIGFTMSIFISMLAFDEEQAITTAKVAVLLASLISALLGFFVLKNMFKSNSGEQDIAIESVEENE